MDAIHQRLVTKVARLYHLRGLRQADIAARLELSQSRVSRLLTQAEESGVVRTVVVTPPGPSSELEDALEVAYGLDEVHVVEVEAGAGEDEVARDLGQAAAAVLAGSPLRARTVGYAASSRTLRHCVEAMVPQTSAADAVVELVGDLGTPALQHEATRSTEQLARLLGAEPVYLRVPGVVGQPGLREALLAQDHHARRALAALDDLDVVLVDIGPAGTTPSLSGAEHLGDEQFAQARELGAVGHLCLHFLDGRGELLDTPLDGLAIGITAQQLRRTPRRIGVVGGADATPAVRAALVGGWVSVLFTDSATASTLVDDAPCR